MSERDTGSHHPGDRHGSPAVEQDELSSTPDRLESRRSFGTAIGAAMLGLEQALRSQPPPQVMAVRHAPIRGLSGQDDGPVLVFPDEPPSPGSGQADLHAHEGRARPGKRDDGAHDGLAVDDELDRT